ncbi:MAG TPA: DUF4388 domain-containing protein [Holophagaceae bacterium]
MSLTALKDLFSCLRARTTGVWRLGHEPQRTLFLEAGDVVFATSTHPQDRLTHLLVERGKITQAQLDYALANLDPGMSIGKNLIQMGFITQRDLLEVARAQVERVVWSALADEEHDPNLEPRELDATTVRLPFDTPLMLLSGVLNLRNRESVLEELGPLNQVVVLEGRRIQELTLPPDLSRLPSLLDGTRTLLELSRESGVEPFRLGAFALFLREMGWARLHELPPLDRRALELALEPTEPDLSPRLPEPPPEPTPSLFSEIHASQLPTTNLEHLSEALDKLGPTDELPETVPLPPDPEPALIPPVEPEPEPERALRIQHEAFGSTESSEPPPSDTPVSPSSRSRALLWLIPLLALVGWGGYRMLRARRKATSPQPSPAAQAVVQTPAQPTKPAPAPEPPSAAPKPPEPTSGSSTPSEPSSPTPPAPAPPKPEPSRAPSASREPASRTARLEAIWSGNWSLALSQGEAQRRLLGGKWTLRLEIACQGGTVQRAASLLKDHDPDLFLLPMTLRDGRTCYQVFLGAFGSESAALKAARRLPAPFRAEGNRPKPFRASDIPSRQ